MRVWMHAQHGTRMGNWMFQYAAALSLSDDVGCWVEEDKLAEKMRKCSWLADLPFTRERPKDAEEWTEERLFVFKPVAFDRGKDLILTGLYQNSRYFATDKVRKAFGPKEADIQRLREEYHEAFSHPDLTSIGVRRGDYMHCPHEFPFVGERYYLEAIGRFSDVSNFLICSDDIEWCKGFFNDERFLGKRFYFSRAKSVDDDIALPALCKNNILANSTFSWWGGYLNDNPGKRTIAPSRWLGTKYKKQGVDWSDVYYEGTEIIDNDSKGCRLVYDHVYAIWADVIKKRIISPPYQWIRKNIFHLKGYEV